MLAQAARVPGLYPDSSLFLGSSGMFLLLFFPSSSFSSFFLVAQLIVLSEFLRKSIISLCLEENAVSSWMSLCAENINC